MFQPKAVKIIKLFAVKNKLKHITHGDTIELITNHSTYLFCFFETYITVSLEANWNYSEYDNILNNELDKYLKYEVEPYI